MTRLSVACNMLRLAGKLDFADLPAPRRSESLIDYLIRAGIANSPQQAADGLLVAAGLKDLHGDVMSKIETSG